MAAETEDPALKEHAEPALSGLLVIALEQAVAAPLCSARLQQAGARVIKIERSGGDFARGYDQAARGESSYFTWLNQGKESLTLDIKDPADQALLHRLLDRADVFIQNLSPGALGRLGFDSGTLRERYPALITCDISGYGDSDRVAHLRAYDLLVQAESGLTAISGGPGEPGRIGISLCDIGAGITAHAAILEALLKRHNSGAGEALKVSLFDVAAEWMTVPFMHCRWGDGAPTRQGLQHPSIAPYGAYQTEDGVQTLLSIQNQREWERFCDKVLLAPSLAVDPRFESNRKRVENRPLLNTEIAACLRGVDAGTFRQRLADNRIAFGALNSVEELTTHVALRTRTVSNSEGLSMAIPAHPYRTGPDQADRRAHDPARQTPTVGQHNAAIRREFGA